MHPTEDTPGSNGEDSQIETLLDRYYFLVEQGETPTIEEICRDAPELRDRFARLIAAQSELLGDAIGSDPEAVETFVAPERVGIYQIGERIGSGGMGVVYRATNEQGREVALKLLRPELAADSSRRLRFRREARITAAIEHPHIVPVLDTGVVDGHCYLAMRLLDGHTLDRVADTIDEREAARIGAKVARALHSAHEVGVVHRDVKPGNVLLEDGEPFLLDFGLARNRLDWALTRDGHMPGTLAYMAPEQLKGDNEQIGPRADVYALGATLHQLVAGTPPFDDTTPEALMRSVLVDRPRLGRKTGHSAAFARIVEKALEKDPRDRFDTAQEFAEELERFADGSSILTRARPLRLRMQRQIRRYPRTVGLAAAASVAIAWLGGQRLVDRARRADEFETRVAAIEMDLAEGRHHQALVRIGDIDREDPVIDGTRIDALESQAVGRRLLDQTWELLLAERNYRDTEPLDRLHSRLTRESPVVARTTEARLAELFIDLLRVPDSERSRLLGRFEDSELTSLFPRTTSLARGLIDARLGAEPSPGRNCDDYVFAALLRQIFATPMGSIREELGSALELDPAHRRANLLDAHLLHREGNILGARAAMRALLRPDDPRPETELRIAHVAMRQYDDEGARRWIESAAGRFRELDGIVPLRAELAWIRLLMKMGRLDEAEERIQQASGKFENSPWLRLYEAQIIGTRGDLLGARTRLGDLVRSTDLRAIRHQCDVRILNIDAVAASRGLGWRGNTTEERIRRARDLEARLTADDDQRLLSEVQRIRSLAHLERNERDEATTARKAARENDPLHPRPAELYFIELAKYPDKRARTAAIQGISEWLDQTEQASGDQAPPPRRSYDFAVRAAGAAALNREWDVSRGLLTRSDELLRRGAHATEDQRQIAENVRRHVKQHAR